MQTINPTNTERLKTRLSEAWNSPFSRSVRNEMFEFVDFHRFQYQMFNHEDETTLGVAFKGALGAYMLDLREEWRLNKAQKLGGQDAKPAHVLNPDGMRTISFYKALEESGKPSDSTGKSTQVLALDEVA